MSTQPDLLATSDGHVSGPHLYGLVCGPGGGPPLLQRGVAVGHASKPGWLVSAQHQGL